MHWSKKLARRVRLIRNLPVLSAIIGAGALSACGSDVVGADTSSPSAPGWLSVQLTTPHTNDGAVQLFVSGPATIDSMKATGYTGYPSDASTSVQLIVTGNISSGAVARFYVHDVSRAVEYRVSVVAAAARTTYALQNMQGYTATVTK
jgi:hypothetical protein